MTADGANIELHPVHVMNGERIRGAERFALELSEALVPTFPAQSIFAMSCDEAWQPDLSGRLLIRQTSRPTSLSSIFSLRRYLLKTPGAVVIAHGYTALKLTALATLGLPEKRRPVIINKKIGESRAWLGRLAAPRLFLQRLLLRRADIVVALGHRQHAELTGLLRLPPECVQIIPNGRFRPSIAPPAFATRPKTPRIIMLGALSHEKNPHLVLGLVAKMADKGIDCNLVFAGDGMLRATLEAQAACLGIGERTHFLGQVSDPNSVLAECHVLVLCSETEGFPGVVIEAGMMRLPVVCWDVGEVSDAILDGENGFCVPFGDRDALADALEHAVTNPDVLNRFSDSIFEYMQRFEINRIAERYAEMLTAVTVMGKK